MAKLPTVVHGVLCLDGDERIELHTPNWVTWLHRNDSFRYEPQFPKQGFTARVEKSVYWYGYRRILGKLHKCYIGKSSELTVDRLEQVALELEQPPQPRQKKVTQELPKEKYVTNYATVEEVEELRSEVSQLKEQLAAILGKSEAWR